MENKNMGYNGIFLERFGTDGLELAERLVAPPEFPLDDEQRLMAHDFEKDIIGHKLESGITVENAIQNHRDEGTIAPRFFAKAFLEGRIELPPTLSEIPVFYSSEDVYKWLAVVVRDSTFDETNLLRMAKESADYYKHSVASFMLSGETPDPLLMDCMSIVINPTETILSARSIAQARLFIRDLHRSYKEGGDRLEGAKRAIADVYLGKINELVASDITTLESLINQSRLIRDIETEQAATDVIPESINIAFNGDKIRTLRRLDFLRNGMGIDDDGHPTAIESLIVKVENNEIAESVDRKPLFTLEQREKLKAYMMSPTEMVQIFSNILQNVGLLSSEDSSTWSPKRNNRASDELFQVIVNPSANVFSIDGSSGVYKVASESRSLFDAIVVGGFHELEHVIQTQNDRKFEKNLFIRGKRVSMLRESGANDKQREGEQMLFGESKPIALAYARALQTLEDGGDLFAATRSFFDEKCRTAPDTDRSLFAKEAADRVLRLIRYGGLNSQPMAYAEEIILDYELRDSSPEVKARAFAVTSLDLVDQVRLHKYGLLLMANNQGINLSDVIMTEFEPYIDKALSNG